MDDSLFSSSSPGQLVPTTAFERDRPDGPLRTARGRAFLPAPLPPNLDWTALVGRLHDFIATAQAGLAQVDGMASTLPNAYLLARPLLLREAQLSSRIENTYATAQEVGLAEIQERAGQAGVRAEAREVSNYVQAMNHGLNSDLPLCNRLFREMHEILLRGVRGEEFRPGRFRNVQNWIGHSHSLAAARFVPPPPGEPLEHCMADLERFLNTKDDKVPPLVRIALAHYQFECAHPFADGNGRVGRLVAALSLLRYGLISRPLVYVSGFLEANRENYYDHLLQVSTDGDWESWIAFFCHGVTRQAFGTMKIAVRLLDLRDELLRQLTGRRRSSLLLRLVETLFEHPVLTMTDAAERLEVSYQAARKHVKTLVEEGILKQVTRGNYNVAFCAPRILLAIEDFDTAPEPG